MTSRALRGSSEFHAWGDSNLYLRRLGNELTLTVKHRAAPSPPAVSLELTQQGEALALEVRALSVSEVPAPTSVDDRILTHCATPTVPCPPQSCARSVRHAKPHSTHD
jgi:hypothetical protein